MLAVDVEIAVEREDATCFLLGHTYQARIGESHRHISVCAHQRANPFGMIGHRKRQIQLLCLHQLYQTLVPLIYPSEKKMGFRDHCFTRIKPCGEFTCLFYAPCMEGIAAVEQRNEWAGIKKDAHTLMPKSFHILRVGRQVSRTFNGANQFLDAFQERAFRCIERLLGERLFHEA